MAVRITAEINGVKEVDVLLGVAATGLSDWSKPLHDIEGELLKAYNLNFDARGARYGGWAPRKIDQPWPLLEKTGQMRKAYNSALAGKDTLVISNPTPYFRFHQLGTSRLPQRVMLMIDSASRNVIIKAFQSYIQDLLKGRS